jgi:hypothetical protein
LWLVGWARDRFPAMQVFFFSFLHIIQTESENHTASYPMGTGALSMRCISGWDVKLTTYLHLVPSSKKVELTLHSTCAFMD